MKYISKNTAILFCTLITLFSARLYIAGKGYLDDTDEFLYLFIERHLDELLNADIKIWSNAIYHIQGQIPEIIIRTTQANFIRHFISEEILSLSALYYIGIINCIISTLQLFFFYKILEKLKVHFQMRIIGIILLGTLVNFTMYTRHILPYDNALLFLMISIYLFIDNHNNRWMVFSAGIFAAIGIFNYLGYIYYLIFFGLLILKYYSKNIISLFLNSTIFFIPFVSMFLLYEYISQKTGKSYLQFLQSYDDSVNQASSDEGINYVFKYLSQIESFSGKLIIIFISFSMIRYLYQIYHPIKIRKKILSIEDLFMMGMIMYFIFGTIIYLGGNARYYGRVIHSLYPFLIMGCIYFLQIPFSKKLKLHIIVPFIFIITYFFELNSLNQIDYPRSVMEKLLTKDFSKINCKNESTTYIDYCRDNETFSIKFNNQIQKYSNLELINFSFFIHHPDTFQATYNKYIPTKNQKLIYQGQHFMSHPIYTFEYCSREGREYFINKQFKLLILSNNLN